jgi:ER degradation enhancer, mannosidase alpha-like 1
MSFDMDVRVNVFEANIRLLGGLLSGHLLAEDPRFGGLPGYQGELLDLAYELGLRLLPAFLESPTGDTLDVWCCKGLRQRRLC